jgi:hypothetical protein
MPADNSVQFDNLSLSGPVVLEPQGLRELSHRSDGKAAPSPHRPLVRPKMGDDYTFHAVEAAKRKPDSYWAPTPEALHGFYEGHPIIGRDSPKINGGVYFSSNNGIIESEILVVDDGRNPGTEGDPSLGTIYSEVLTDVLQRVPQIRNADKTAQDYKAILDVIYANAQRLLPYDLDRTKQVQREFKGQKVSLGYFIKGGFGVCRQQALLAAYLLEKLQTQTFLKGIKVSVDRNYDRETGDGHAWTRFTAPNGEVYIIDPAQHYVGKLRDTQGEIGAGRVWDYGVVHGR